MPHAPSQTQRIVGSELPRLTEARTLTDICGASRVDASDLFLIQDSDDDIDWPIRADDPEERYPDGEFEEWDEEDATD